MLRVELCEALKLRGEERTELTKVVLTQIDDVINNEELTEHRVEQRFQEIGAVGMKTEFLKLQMNVQDMSKDLRKSNRENTKLRQQQEKTNALLAKIIQIVGADQPQHQARRGEGTGPLGKRKFECLCG